jgi:hypothetical protein
MKVWEDIYLEGGRAGNQTEDEGSGYHRRF